MIRVTVELISARGAQFDKILDVVTVTNDGTGDQDLGNYDVAWEQQDRSAYPERRARVTRFLRQRRPSLELVYEAIRAVLAR